MDNIQSFKNNFNPYHKGYIYQSSQNELFSSWQTSDSYLTDNMINSGLLGLKTYGYFLSTCPSCFGLDVDDHKQNGDGYLLSILDSIQNRFYGLAPSVLCRSPHGLHAYYFLEYPLPFSILEERIKTATAGLPVEIKPTTKSGIRFPKIGNFLNPETYLPIKKDFTEIVDFSRRYHPAELFTNIAPADIRSSKKDRKNKVFRIRALKQIATIESGFPCIYDGNTNEALIKLIPVYRSSGLSVEESAQRFYANLAPVYDGELRNYHRLLSRIKSFYRNEPNQFKSVVSKKDIQIDFYSEMLATSLANKVTGQTETPYQRTALTKKKRTVYNAVLRIENWKKYIDEIKNNKQISNYWNYIYPFFQKNTSEGFYPLPQNLLKEIHTRYDVWLFPFLLQNKYIEKSPYGYSAGQGICLHYKINQELK